MASYQNGRRERVESEKNKVSEKVSLTAAIIVIIPDTYVFIEIVLSA